MTVRATINTKSRAVPDEMLHKNGANLVAIDPDKCAWPLKSWGFILARAGFAE